MAERDELLPRRISRDKLALFLPNQELIRAFEMLMGDMNLAGEKLRELQIGDAGTAAALSEALARVSESMPALDELADLRERLAQLEAALQIDYSSALNALREEVATVGNKRKRVIRDTLIINAGSTTGSYTITPALAGLDLADLRMLGASNTGAAPASRIRLASTTTITANRGSNVGDENINFELTEYLP